MFTNVHFPSSQVSGLKEGMPLSLSLWCGSIHCSGPHFQYLGLVVMARNRLEPAVP